MAICKLFNCFLRNAHVIQKILSEAFNWSVRDPCTRQKRR